jgi:hypothetical protein
VAVIRGELCFSRVAAIASRLTTCPSTKLSREIALPLTQTRTEFSPGFPFSRVT